MFWGVVAIATATYLLKWNEGRAVRSAQGLAQGIAELVSIDANSVDSRNEKRLVHVTGSASSDETLRDPRLGVSAKAIRLERRVEVYQWQELEEQRSRQQSDGRTVTETVYTYQPAWVDRSIDSKRFRSEEGRRDHVNPAKVEFEPWSQIAESVRVGRLSLSSRLVEQLREFESLPVTDDVVGQLPAELQSRAKVFNGRLHLSDDPASPRVGDVRFEFRVVPATIVSVIARQVGSTLDTYPIPTGGTLEILRVGKHEPREMYHAAVQERDIWSWAARATAIVLLVLGVGGVTRMLAGLLLMVPVVSDMLHAGTRLFNLVVAVAAALTISALTWMSLHPFVCGLALGGVVAVMYVVWRLGRRRRLAETSTVTPAA
jgi:hypothetical protein